MQVFLINLTLFNNKNLFLYEIYIIHGISMYYAYYLFIFSFCLEAKRKNEPKKKNSHYTTLPPAAFRSQNISIICSYVFALQAKIKGEPK